ncbi:hypothetical protein CTAYLR_007899 [Chrysophaeum taylorii]|uniref:1,4-dihydroxy-2-naphthoate polyprenyltransferase n=1 Tax=Chrysophaeum taylorii TaxID=2483200 RepID=A0AAD7UN23_9STRA|nr:hypothetical protein CTAYLR_007899 [Chrysophaeum taylorii]
MGSNERPPLWKVIVLATRPNTLTLSFTPVAVGAALAAKATGEVSLGTALAFWAFACLIQVGTNLHNDYADFVKGADTKDRVGQARATQKGWLTARQTAGGATVALVLAALVGSALASRPGCGGVMAVVTATSVFNAVAYTGGPYPLGYVGLGWLSLGYSGLADGFVLAYFGYVATLAPSFLQRPWHLLQVAPPREPTLAATSLGFLATAVLVVNNLRDRRTDVLVGKRTLAVRFGQAFGRAQYLALLLGAYAVVAAAVALRLVPTLWLLAFASAPLARLKLRAVLSLDGAALNPHVGGTAKLQLAFGMLLLLAIVLAPPPSQ